MITRFAWTGFNSPGHHDWMFVNEEHDEEKICEWADNYPNVIFFFVNISTDISEEAGVWTTPAESSSSRQ